jgi:hypothetical protein
MNTTISNKHKELSFVVYTHSEYSFLWKAFIPLLEKYAPEFQVYWCCDKLLDFKLPSSWIIHIYDTSLNWSYRIKDCVEKINTDYLIYLQEDWLLIDKVEESKIKYILEFMKSRQCEFVMAGIRQKIASEPISTIYENYVFQRINGHWMQPAIWSKSLFEKLVNIDIPIKEYELGAAYVLTKTAVCYSLTNNGFQEQSTRALYYPHMHAIVGGKWTFLKYPVLKALVETFGIDTKTRDVDTKWLIKPGSIYNMN